MAPKRCPEVPLDPRMTVAGAVVDDEGKLVRGVYKELQDRFGDDEAVAQRPLQARGVEPGEEVHEGLRAWDDCKGSGWIAKHPSKRQHVWYNCNFWGSWRFAFLLAALQRNVWANEGARPGTAAASSTAAAAEAPPAPKRMRLKGKGPAPELPPPRPAAVSGPCGPPQTRRRAAAAAAAAAESRPARRSRRVALAERQRINERTTLPDSLRDSAPRLRTKKKKKALRRRHRSFRTPRQTSATRRTAAQALLSSTLVVDLEECGKLVERVSAARLSDSVQAMHFEASALAAFARTMGMTREERDRRLLVVSSTISIQRSIQEAFLSPEAARGLKSGAAASRGSRGSVAQHGDLSPDKLPASANPLRKPLAADKELARCPPEPLCILEATAASCRTTRLFQGLSRASDEVPTSLTNLPAPVLLQELLEYLTLVEAFRASCLCRAFREVCAAQAAGRLQALDVFQFGAPLPQEPGSRRCRPTFSCQGPEAFVQCLREPSLLRHFRRLDLRGLPARLLSDKGFAALLVKIPQLRCIVVSEADWETREDFKGWLKRLPISESVQIEAETWT